MAALLLALPTYEAALVSLKAQGLDFNGIDTAALLRSEAVLGDLSARVMASTVAQKAIRLVAGGATPQEAVSRALRETRGQVQAAFDTNLRTAYGHGRYKRAMETPGLSYFTFKTRRDARVRASHQRLHGTTLPKAHKFWHNHTAPLGFGCRCITEGMSTAQLKEQGILVSADAPGERFVEYKNKNTGEVELAPESSDPGWLIDGKSPAIDPLYTLQKVLARKQKELAQKAVR